MIITIMEVMTAKVIIISNNNSNINSGDNINIGIELKNWNQIEIRKMK